MKRLSRISEKTIGKIGAVIISMVIAIGANVIYINHVLIDTTTQEMDDQAALEYILQMSDDDRLEYLTTVRKEEADRLKNLYYAYKFAEAESRDTFNIR